MRLPKNQVTATMPITIYLRSDQYEWLDDFIKENGFRGRSDAIRELVDYLMNHDDSYTA